MSPRQSLRRGAAALLLAGLAAGLSACSVGVGFGFFGGSGGHRGTAVGVGVGASVPLTGEATELAPGLAMLPERVVPAGRDGHARAPALAYGGGRYLLVWQEGWNGLGGSSRILALRLDESGRPLDRRPIAVSAAEGVGDSPNVAFCAGRFLVVWSELREGKDYDVWGSLLDLDGKVTREPFLLAGGPGGQARPAAASDGAGRFLAAWQDAPGEGGFAIRCARLSAPDGAVLDSPPTEVMPRGEIPDAVWAGGRFLVCQKWYAALVGADGKVAVPPARIWHTRSVHTPAAAAAWDRPFVFMNTEPTHDPWGWGGGGAIIGVSVDADGRSPEQEVLGGKRVSDAAKADGLVRNCLDAARWRNHPGWPSGMPGGFKGTHSGTWPSGPVAAAWNGRGLLVAWSRAHIADKNRLVDRDLYLRRVGRGWGYAEREPVLVAGGPADEASPALCGGKPGRAVLAWEQVEPRGGVSVRYRLIVEGEDVAGPRPAYTRRWSDTEMSLVFDEPVDPESASKPEAYAIEGLEVRSAEFDDDPRTLGREVRLVTAPVERGRRYVLRVSGVRDRSERGNVSDGKPWSFTAKPGASAKGEFVERWLVAGPVPHAWEASGKAAAARLDGAEGAKPVDCGGGAILALSALFGEKEGVSALAGTWVWSDRARKALLRIDATDGHRAWLNGRLVSSDAEGLEKGRGLHDRTDEPEVRLERGWNRLVVQHSNRFGRWQLVVQITDPGRRPLADLAWQLQTPAKQ